MDARRAIEAIDRLLESVELRARRIVNEALLGVSTVRLLRAQLRESLRRTYGHWISPRGDLIEVPRHGHARVAADLARRYGIEPDPDIMDAENRWRIPFVRQGWARVVTGEYRLTVQAMYLPRPVVATIVELADSYLPRHEVVVDLFDGRGGTDTIVAASGDDIRTFRTKLNRLAAKAPRLPSVPLRKAESVLGLTPSLAEAGR